MTIYTLTKRLAQFQQWERTLGGVYKIKNFGGNDLAKALQKLPHGSIFIVDMVSQKARFVSLLQEHPGLAQHVRCIALSNIPNIHECLGLLKYGVIAYGNNMMEPVIFQEMLEKVSHGHMWFPDLILEDVIRVLLHSQDQPQKMDSLDILTAREQEVAYLVAQGLSNKEIAQRLELSAETVKLHLSHVYQKLDIDNRVALALKLKV